MHVALRRRMGGLLEVRERIVAFMPQCAAYLKNMLHRGEDRIWREDIV